MGCLISTPKDASVHRRRPASIGEVAVFVPGFRIPKSVDFSQPLGGCLPKGLVERLSALRTRVVVMAAQEAPVAMKPRRRTATRHGGSTFADLRQALEDYLPVLLGLMKDGSQLESRVQFAWVNQEDDAEETAMTNAWYEVLSVLHLMAMLCLSEANLLLLPKTSIDGYQPRLSEDCRRNSIDVFLKAAGYLDCAIQHILPKIPSELRSDLPVDLTEGVLRALCMQALGKGVDVQLGMAIDSPKATLAVKRRLACEMVKYWHQVQVLRSDNGKEYLSSNFSRYLFEHGIVHQTSCVYTPQQNGVAEHKNRHLLEVFGCTCFVHLPKPGRAKLEPTSLKCVFLGYSPTQKATNATIPLVIEFLCHEMLLSLKRCLSSLPPALLFRGRVALGKSSLCRRHYQLNPWCYITWSHHMLKRRLGGKRRQQKRKYGSTPDVLDRDYSRCHPHVLSKTLLQNQGHKMSHQIKVCPLMNLMFLLQFERKLTLILPLLDTQSLSLSLMHSYHHHIVHL